MKEVRDFSGESTTGGLRLGGDEDEGRGLGVKLSAAVFALLLTAALIGGYLYLRGRNAQAVRARREAEQAALAAERAAPPRAQVFQDEVLLKGSKAVAGGSVRNISDAPLEGLAVEIELRARGGQTSERHAVGVEPARLGPGEEGRFAFQFTAADWSGTRVARLLVAGGASEVPFKPEIGAKRPPERTPTPKLIVVPRPRGKGDDFINTPDTPTRIP